MNNPDLLESCYKKYITNIDLWLPDGVFDVNLELLHRLDLLHYHRKNAEDSMLTRYFHVIESDEKLTLINEDYIIWIVPEKVDLVPTTTTLIALNKEENVQLELGFTTSGIYNNSQLVLKVLEKYLQEIQNTEDVLASLKNS